MLTCDMKQFHYELLDEWLISKEYASIFFDNIDIRIRVRKYKDEYYFTVNEMDREGNDYNSEMFCITEDNIKRMQSIIAALEKMYLAHKEFNLLAFEI
ncbi:hypothetical protein OO184_10790 [Photorhabdus sp. APURE]|uniref:hypothetical protein n=1 Tax=Photorhabdus aballayi TaxID=2991723 RepID=UPI00223DC125|nr:hypothetical protein [Photorhabdus aballayi]MCW7548414.1 hypothetical protein [Photorhabdus aballayi]